MKYDRIIRAGVYAAPRVMGPLRAAARRAGLAWRDLDLQGVGTPKAFLERCAAAFALPDYFGHNWDALHECLLEDDGGGARGVVAHWRRGAALAKRYPGSVDTALEILREASIYRAARGGLLVVVVDRDSAPGRDLPPLR